MRCESIVRGQLLRNITGGLVRHAFRLIDPGEFLEFLFGLLDELPTLLRDESVLRVALARY